MAEQWAEQWSFDELVSSDRIRRDSVRRDSVRSDSVRRDSVIVNPGFEDVVDRAETPPPQVVRRRSDSLAPDSRSSPKRRIPTDHVRDSMRGIPTDVDVVITVPQPGTSPYPGPGDFDEPDANVRQILRDTNLLHVPQEELDDDIEFTRAILARLPSRQMSAKDSMHRSIGTAKRRRQSIYASQRLTKRRDLTDSLADGLALADDDILVPTTDDLREMGTNLTRRKTLKAKLDTIEKKKHKRVGCFKKWKYSVIMWFRHQNYKLEKSFQDLELWAKDMKRIESRFGSGVTSYFRFLRWLFVLNLPTFLMLLAFLTIPQSVYRFLQQEPSGYLPPTEPVQVYKELLTGAGWFDSTEMYYGYYYNGTINVISVLNYNMQHAYILTIGGYFLIWLIILARSIANSYRKNYIEGSDEFNFYYVSKIFVGWDHTITDAEAANLKHQSMYSEFREYLSVFRKKPRVKYGKDLCNLIALRATTNIVVLASISGAAYLIWYISVTQSLQTSLQVLRELAMPLCVSVVNYFLPIAFSIIGTFERYQKPRTELYVTMARTVLLKGAVLSVLIYIWFNLVACKNLSDVQTQYQKDFKCIVCWENFMGQEIYRLMLVDFVITLLITFVDEYLRRIMSTYCCKKMPHPEFDIARNTLNLIYSQTLCWLGQYYSPLLTILQLLKLIIIFHVKSCSVRQNCSPSSKPWRGARVHTIFLGFLSAAFLMAAISVAANVIFIKPSESCGPYRGLASSYESILVLIKSWKDKLPWLSDIISFISSTGFVAFLIAFLIIGAHYLRLLVVARKKSVKMMKHQLSLEGRDKVFLVNMYKEASSRVGFRPAMSQPRTTSRLDLDLSAADGNTHAPGGRAFAKAVIEGAEERSEHNAPDNSVIAQRMKEIFVPPWKQSQEHLRVDGGQQLSKAQSLVAIPNKQAFDVMSGNKSSSASDIPTSGGYRQDLPKSNFDGPGNYVNVKIPTISHGKKHHSDDEGDMGAKGRQYSNSRNRDNYEKVWLATERRLSVESSNSTNGSRDNLLSNDVNNRNTTHVNDNSSVECAPGSIGQINRRY